MRSFVALVGYEIREWQGLVWAGALLGAIGWAAPLLPGMGHAAPAEARQATAAVLAALVAVLGPVFVGSSLVARDLAAGRFGFFLTLPVSAGRLWAAKVVGATAAVYLALLLVVLPGATAVTIAPDLDYEGATLAWWAFAVALAPLALLLLSHLFGLALRARNAWLLVDVIALALVGGAVSHWVTGLWRQGAVFESVWGLAGFLLIGIGALLVAGWRQVVAGDLLLERARRVYGRWAWSLLVVATLALGVWTWWIRSATPSDIVMVRNVVLGPDAELTLVRGELRGRPSYRPWFLLYGEDRWANVGWLNFPRVVYSADGQKVAWVGESDGDPELTVAELDDEGGVRFASLEVSVPMAATMAFSPDGEQIAAFLGSALLIFDLPSGRLVGHHQVLMRGISDELFWPNEGIIRVVSTTYMPDDWRQLQVAEVDLGSGQVSIREPVSPSEPGGSWQ